MTDPILFELDERGVATITLNRPGRLNALNMECRDLLWTYLQACRDMPDVRLVLFRGNGPSFCAGADISEFGTAPSIMDSRRARHDRDVWALLLSLPAITVARMHGYCYGAGLELPLCCDYRIATQDASFALPEVTLGYIPSACGTQTLPRIAPPGVAAHMILSGEPIGAADALRWGVIDSTVAAGDLDAALEEEIARLLAMETGSATARRRAMVASLPGPAPMAHR